MRTMILTLALIIATSGLAACNTVEGAGQDIQTGGKKLERSADENKGRDSRNYR
jgi:entericidin B